MRFRGARMAVALGVSWAACSLAGCSTQTPADVTRVPASVASGYPAEVTATLCAAGLHPVFVTAPAIRHADRNVNGYAVTSVSPVPGDVAASGSSVQVHLVVSANGGGPWPPSPATTVLPRVIGMDVNAAMATLTADGVLVDVTTVTPTGTMLVAGQAPEAGATVRRASTVTLTVGVLDGDGCVSS